MATTTKMQNKMKKPAPLVQGQARKKEYAGQEEPYYKWPSTLYHEMQDMAVSSQYCCLCTTTPLVPRFVVVSVRLHETAVFVLLVNSKFSSLLVDVLAAWITVLMFLLLAVTPNGVGGRC
jgi:hypothetical protein